MVEGATPTRPAASKAVVKEALKKFSRKFHLLEPYSGEVGLEAAARALGTGLRGEL